MKKYFLALALLIPCLSWADVYFIAHKDFVDQNIHYVTSKNGFITNAVALNDHVYLVSYCIYDHATPIQKADLVKFALESVRWDAPKP